MVITITVNLKFHDVPLNFKIERRAGYIWVQSHATQIDALEIDCGLNLWSWSPYTGWTQFPQHIYTPGKGVHRAYVKPIRHGNSYDARHPWSYCLNEVITPNPLSFIDENAIF